MTDDDSKGRVFAEASDGYIDFAYMEFLGIDFSVTAGFGDGAAELFDIIEEEDKIVSVLFFPACFLFRHFVELQCKRIIQLSNQLRGSGEPATGHNLKTLWDRARLEVKHHIPEVKEETLTMIAELIGQFMEADPTGEHFRYWQTIKGEETLPTLPGRIGIQNLRNWMHVIQTILTDYAFHLMCEIEEKLEKDESG